MLSSFRPRAGSVIRHTKRALRAVLGSARDELLRNVAGLPIPVYLTATGVPSAQPTQGSLPHRTIVCSVPKAGTYLVGEVLRRLGAVATEFHFSADGLMFMDSRFATREEARKEFGRLCHAIPLERALPLVLPGQYAVSHLECTPRVQAHLSDFKVVFAYRELRDALVSWLRFHQATGREERWNWIWEQHSDKCEQLTVFLREAGELFFGVCRGLLPWLSDADAFPVRFETLHGDDGAKAQERLCRELAAFVGHANPSAAPAVVLPGLTAVTTLTSSGSRTNRAEFWSDAAEELFVRFGGAELNAAFGYRERLRSGPGSFTLTPCSRGCV